MAVNYKRFGEVAHSIFHQYNNVTIPFASGGSNPESGLDCGGFIVYCFARCGESLKIKGTNDLFRRPDRYHDSIENAFKENWIVDGSLAFIVENDGGEREHGYDDNLGNAIAAGIVYNNMIIYYSKKNQAILEAEVKNRALKNWWSHIKHIDNLVSYYD